MYQRVRIQQRSELCAQRYYQIKYGACSTSKMHQRDQIICPIWAGASLKAVVATPSIHSLAKSSFSTSSKGSAHARGGGWNVHFSSNSWSITCQYLMFMCLVLGLNLDTVAIVFAPVLSSKSLHLTLLTSSKSTIFSSLSSSIRLITGVAVLKLL